MKNVYFLFTWKLKPFSVNWRQWRLLLLLMSVEFCSLGKVNVCGNYLEAGTQLVSPAIFTYSHSQFYGFNRKYPLRAQGLKTWRSTGGNSFRPLRHFKRLSQGRIIRNFFVVVSFCSVPRTNKQNKNPLPYVPTTVLSCVVLYKSVGRSNSRLNPMKLWEKKKASSSKLFISGIFFSHQHKIN